MVMKGSQIRMVQVQEPAFLTGAQGWLWGLDQGWPQPVMGNGPAEEATDVDADMCLRQRQTPPAFQLLQLLLGGVRGGGWEKEMRQGLLSRRKLP